MRETIIYEAEDGTRFDSEAKCRDYERLIDALDTVMSLLPERPDTCSFTNGDDGWIQHDKPTLDKVRTGVLYAIASSTFGSYCSDVLQECAHGVRHISHAARYLDGVPYGIIKHLNRFQCIGIGLREYGQPYYAHNPDQCVDKEYGGVAK